MADAVSWPSEPESPVSLPASINSGSDDDIVVALPGVCCKMGCVEAMRENPQLSTRIAEVQSALNGLESRDAIQKAQYDCLRMWQSSSSGWRRFTVWGIPCCRDAVCEVLKMPVAMFKKLTKHLAQGFVDAPQDLRKSQKQPLERSDAVAAAQVLLQWVHENVAEHLPESDDFVSSKKSLADGPTSVSGLLAAQKGRPVKWLGPNTTLTDMLDFSSSFNPHLEKPSLSTFCRCYHREWQAVLKVRSEGQHSKCATCERLKQFRRLATSKEDVRRCNDQFTAHIKSMLADRHIDAKMNAQAKDSAAGVTLSESSVSITVDGMDAGKFRLPRNLSGSKEFAEMWRPELHFHGMLIDGIAEVYAVSNCNIAKDSNLDMTIVSYGIEQAYNYYQRKNQPLPKVLRLHADNCSSELKNQHVFKYCAWLLSRHLFDEILITTFMVGHSHGRIDQRFAEVRQCLTEAPILQTKADFEEAVAAGVTARDGRCLEVLPLEATIDFQAFLANLPVKVGGHTQTYQKTMRHEESVHVFTFQRRETLADSWSSQVVETFPDEPPSPNDIIMGTRHYMSSAGDSQPPMVFIPVSAWVDLPAEAPQMLCSRKPFSDKQTKELRKTADIVEKRPWEMRAAAAYLRDLVSQDPESDSALPPSMPWVLKGARDDVCAAEAPSALLGDDFAWVEQKRPAAVHVTAVAAPNSGRLPAEPVNEKKGKAKSTAAKSKVKKANSKKKDADCGASAAPAAGSSGVDVSAEPAVEAPLPPTPMSIEARSTHEYLPSLPPTPKSSDLGMSSKKRPGTLKRPASSPKAKAKAKAEARSRLTLVPADAIPLLHADGKCSKCRGGRQGCVKCRKKIGLVPDEHNPRTWKWP